MLLVRDCGTGGTQNGKVILGANAIPLLVDAQCYWKRKMQEFLFYFERKVTT